MVELVTAMPPPPRPPQHHSETEEPPEVYGTASHNGGHADEATSRLAGGRRPDHSDPTPACGSWSGSEASRPHTGRPSPECRGQEPHSLWMRKSAEMGAQAILSGFSIQTACLSSCCGLS